MKFMNHTINLYFDVTLKNKDTKVRIEYYHTSKNLYINTFNGNNMPLYLDDALESLRFDTDEIQKINNFIKYKKVNPNETSESDANRENLKFFMGLLCNHQRNIIFITELILEISTDNGIKAKISMETDYSCTTENNIIVTINESIRVTDPETNKILKENNFCDVDLKNMDKAYDESNKIFKTIFNDIYTKVLMSYISNKTVDYYLNAYDTEPKYMYLALINDETIKKIETINEKIKTHTPITIEDSELVKVKDHFYTQFPYEPDSNIYDIVKAYPIVKEKPTPKYLSKLIALGILNKIVQNIVDNKL